MYFRAGDKFGEINKGNIILKALYGLKSSGVAEILHDLGYKSSLADPDIWYHVEVRPYGFKYYAYVLAYVDDILVISHDATTTMTALSKLFCLKDDLSPPRCYAGATIKKWCMMGDESAKHWGHISSEEFDKQTTANAEHEQDKQGRRVDADKVENRVT